MHLMHLMLISATIAFHGLSSTEIPQGLNNFATDASFISSVTDRWMIKAATERMYAGLREATV